MKRIFRFVCLILMISPFLLTGPLGFAKGKGKAGGGLPGGFEKGEKKGWPSETPPGWSHGDKKGWGEEKVPPGLREKTE